MAEIKAENHRQQTLPRIVIIGGGFAGLEAAKALKNAPVEITLLDRTNHHVFQPLLYQVATAALAPSEITSPIRYILRKQKNVKVLLSEVSRIDVENKIVYGDKDALEFPYDYLLLATGTRHSYFGRDEWAQNAPGLKSISDALEIRKRFLLAFEEAEKATDQAKRTAYMTFVIVGGGPTGCELAGVLPEIAHHSLRPDFRNIDTDHTRVILLEAGPRILPQFPEDLAATAQKDLEKLGVTVRVGARVVDIEPSCVYLDGGETIPTHTIIWAAGNAASPLAKSLHVPLDRAGRVPVEKDLSVPGHPEIFVAGDLAVTTMKNGQPVPGVAQGAMQGGHIAGRNILHRIYREETEPFHYWDKGNLAVIGRHKAIADLHFAHLKGFIAWTVWLFIHILYLVGFRNRLSVLFQWAYAYMTSQRGVRLISEGDNKLSPVAQAKESVGPWPS